MAKWMNKLTKTNLQAISKWIEENKHKYPNGVTSSLMFAHVTKRTDGSDEYYPRDMNPDDPHYTQYVTMIGRYRYRKYIEHKVIELGKPPVWVVNERCFDRPSAEDYTGVKNSPLASYVPPQPEPATPAVDLEQVKQEAMDKATNEIVTKLKQIWVDFAQLKLTEDSQAKFRNVSLYSLYQAGLPLLDDICRLKVSEEAPAAPALEEVEETTDTNAPF